MQILTLLFKFVKLKLYQYVKWYCPKKFFAIHEKIEFFLTTKNISKIADFLAFSNGVLLKLVNCI